MRWIGLLLGLYLLATAPLLQAEVIPNQRRGELLIKGERHARLRVIPGLEGIRVCDPRYHLCANLTLADASLELRRDLTSSHPGSETVLTWVLGASTPVTYENGDACVASDACTLDPMVLVLLKGEDGGWLGGFVSLGRDDIQAGDMIAFQGNAKIPTTIWLETTRACGDGCAETHWTALACGKRGRGLVKVAGPFRAGDLDHEIVERSQCKLRRCDLSRRGEPLFDEARGEFVVPDDVHYARDRTTWRRLTWSAPQHRFENLSQSSEAAPPLHQSCHWIDVCD